MVKHDDIPRATYTPLVAQRRGRRERALATLYDLHSGRTLAPLPAGEAPDAHAAAARPSEGRLGGFVRRAFGAVLGGHSDGHAPFAVAPTPRSSATAAAALAQRITGPGSGPYSGTPFHAEVARAAVNPRRTTAGDAVSEAARHDHGIIDHSRHVSSIGRR